jgi:integrase
MPRITKRVVDAIRPDPSGKDVFVWDGELRGFGVRMKPSGAGAYLIQYRNVEGRTRRLVVGKLGTLTPDEARDLARRKLAAVADGADPSAERHRVREAITVVELCDWYLRDASGHVKATTLAMDKSRIDRHVRPLIGRLTVASLTRADIAKLQADIAAGRTADTEKRKGRGGRTAGGKGVAARTVGMLGTILEFAKGHGVITENPARGVEKYPDGKQRRFLTVGEIGALGTAMRESDESPTALAAVRLLLLTGCRRMEVLALRRDEVDARARCLRLADTKSGYQLRAIGAKAVELLGEQPETESPWVFPGERGEGHFVGLPRVLERLCAKAGLAGITIHVLRHSFAATAAEMGFSELTIAGLLGHSVPGVTARYAHVPDVALVAAADRVAGRIAAALDGEKEGAEVVELRRA